MLDPVAPADAALDDVVALLNALIAIDSVNPDLDPSRPGEGEIAAFVAAWGRARGLEVTVVEARPGRPAVLLRAAGRAAAGPAQGAVGPVTGPVVAATAPDKVGGPLARALSRPRTLVLNAHTDTVGVHGMEAPFVARAEVGRVYGRGAMDMKASLAVCMVATAAAARQGLVGDVVLMAVPDEEHGSTGTEAALSALAPLLAERRAGRAEVSAIVTEPTDLALHVAHRGFALFDVVLTGLASHTSKPDQGVNALTHLGRVLHEVEAHDARLRQRVPHPLLGHGSLQPVLAGGGEELFTTPARAHVTLERRTLPGEGAAAVQAEIREVLARAGTGDVSFAATLTPGVAREPFEADLDAGIVRIVRDAVAETTGTAPALLGAPYWTDAALVAAGGVPTVLFGPVGGGIHRPDEWVDVASVRTMLRVLGRVIRRYCS